MINRALKTWIWIGALGACSLQVMAKSGISRLDKQLGSEMTAAQRHQRDAVIEGNLDKQMLHLADQMKKNANTITTRDLTNGAFFYLERGGSPAIAEALLRKLFSTQSMNPDAKDYGYIPWRVNDSSVHDPNSIDFDMQSMGAIFIGYGDKLSDGFKREAKPHLQAALAALARHRVQVSYTNIYLMNTFDTLTLSQYLNDRSAYEYGRQRWAAWRDYTAHNGIHEFDSPTYYGVDLGDLTLAYRYVADPEIHNQVTAALDYFFKDIASNFHVSSGRMGGPQSRDYDFLKSLGGIDSDLFAEGVLDDQQKLSEVTLEKAAVLDNDRPGGYHPSPAILRQMEAFNRVVEQSWDEDPGRCRYVYLTPEYAIGSTDGAYGPQDKLFSADYGATRRVITSSILVDTFDEPYGLARELDHGGHSKPVHLPANLSSVQDKNTALLVYDLNPEHDSAGKSFATNLLLPSTANDILLDGNPVAISTKLDLPASIGSVIAVRQGNACFAASIWHVDALQQEPPSLRLKADETGLKNGAFRLVVYHGKTADGKGPADHLHVAVLVRMDKCADAGDLRALAESLNHATLTSQTGAETWTATAKLGGLQLSLTEDTRKRLPSSRTVNGQELATPVFAVNGVAITY